MINRKTNPEYENYLKTTKNLAVPKPFRIFGRIIIFFIILTILFLAVTPWVQTSRGVGKMTALFPEDRLQTINALVPGRIGKWYVRDGQKVKRGEPIVEILDNDPNIVMRLQGERNAVLNKLQAAQRAAQTALIDYKRQQELYKEGISSRKDLEKANIQFEKLNSTVASIEAELNNAETKLSRQTTQLVTAPRDGTILSINSGDAATFVKTGQQLATFFPDNVKLAAELYVNGLDAPLISPGREVRLIFEGWPAIQFSGWPSTAIGTFKGVVQVVDPALSANGRIRVLVTEPEDDPWPSSKFLRYGANTRGWILLNTVPLGYELWRQLNNFPPEFSGTKARKQKGVY